MSAGIVSPGSFMPRGHLLVALAVVAVLQPRLAIGAVELAPGLWVDQESERVFMSAASGVPEARALDDGRVLWTGEESALLLMPLEERWLALGQAGRQGWGMLLLLDASTGKVQDRIAFDLPEGVSAAVGAEPMRNFDIRAEDVGGTIRLHWSYLARPLRGALLLEEGAVASEGLELQGVVDVQLGHSQVLAVPRLDVSPAPLRRSPDLPPDQRIAGFGDRQFRAADDAHVQASEAKPDPTFGTVWTWRFASRDRGVLEASLDQPFALAPFLLHGDRLLYQGPPMGYAKPTGEWQHRGLRLVVHDLHEGREVWSVELLDRVFRGALPP